MFRTGQQTGRFERLKNFSPPVEAEFRAHFAEVYYPKTRLILMGTGGAVLIALIVAVMFESLTWPTAAFVLGAVLPLIMATLLLSYKPEAHAGYQTCLALTALCVGLIGTSMTVRASLNGAPYFFGAQVALVFLAWQVLGLLRWHAGLVAVSLSCLYVWGLLHWQVAHPELLFSGITLVVVNLIGGLSCLRLEAAARESFRDTRMLNDLAERDGLTGLYNRRHYDKDIDRLWRQSRRENTQLTLLMVDIDHFKPFNDLYGHQAGDDALKRVAQVIAGCAQRPLDFAARFGGEEFALVLYGPAQDFSREIPETLRRSVEELCIPHAESSTGDWLTVSVGVAIVSPGNERSLAGAIQLADEALYQAKEEGRNRVVFKESRSAHIQTGRFRASKYQSAG